MNAQAAGLPLRNWLDAWRTRLVAWRPFAPLAGNVPRSEEWWELRRAHVKRHPDCEACGWWGWRIHVHHVVPVHLAPERELDPSNLFTLCKWCHAALGHPGPNGTADWMCWVPNVRELAALARRGRAETRRAHALALAARRYVA